MAEETRMVKVMLAFLSCDYSQVLFSICMLLIFSNSPYREIHLAWQLLCVQYISRRKGTEAQACFQENR